MTATVARLILAFTVILFVVFVYIPIAMLIEITTSMDDAWLFLLACVIDAILLIIGWVWVWNKEILWTRRRLSLTLVSIFACLIPALAIGYTMGITIRYIDEIWTACVGILWSIFWLGATAVVWRETATERVERLKMLGINAIACPNCGYNMTGLKQAECPECGAKYTLDQLYAAMKDDGM